MRYISPNETKVDKALYYKQLNYHALIKFACALYIKPLLNKSVLLSSLVQDLFIFTCTVFSFISMMWGDFFWQEQAANQLAYLQFCFNLTHLISDSFSTWMDMYINNAELQQ